MTEFTGEIIKTELIVEGPFGKRRLWKDNGGYFYVVNNIAFRHKRDDCEIYKADSVRMG